MDNQVQKPLLKPLKVPWRISFLQPEFELILAHGKMTQIKFNAEWLPQRVSEDEDVIWTSQTIHMKLENGWTRSQPQFDMPSYDWSAVYPQELLELQDEKNHIPTRNQTLFTTRFKEWEKSWVSKQECGNPMIYRVDNSPLLSDLAFEDMAYHYLFQLEDMTVGIISSLGYWKTEQSTDWNNLEFA